MVRLPSSRVMHKAFAEKDPAFDGTFFVGVKTTNVFCRPVCRAKPARPENIEFFRTSRAALRAGFRPCKLCKPLDASRPPALVERLTKLAENRAGRITERDLRSMGVDPSSARRQFKAYCRTTFSAWQRARRVGKAIQDVKKGVRMSTAQMTAGFESVSGFKDAINKLFGMKDLQTDQAEVLNATWITSPLGPLLAVAGDRGIVMLDFVNKSNFEEAVERLRRKLKSKDHPQTIVPGEHRYLSMLKSQLAEYFAGARKDFSVPLAPHGSEFEMEAWKALRTIPFGETRSYGQQAKAIGRPDAVRAVGAANGRNDISILIPCHRVIGANGSLVGYGGGLERKKWLLEHERAKLW